MKLLKKLVILTASAFMVGGAITFASNSKWAIATSAAAANIELDFSSINKRAASDNGYTAGGVKCSTWRLYCSNTGNGSGPVKVAATVKNMNTGVVFNNADVYVDNYKPNQLFVLSFPGEASWGSNLDYILIHMKKGTSFGGNTVLADDLILYGRYHVHSSGALSLDVVAADYTSSFSYANEELTKRTNFNKIDTEVTKLVGTTVGSTESYFKFNTSVNDINLMSGLSPAYINLNNATKSNTKAVNTNVLSKIKVKYSYSEEYLPLAYYYRPDGNAYLNEGATYRLPLAAPYEENSKFRYVKFEEGLEILSYDYVSQASAAAQFKVYVNSETVEFAQNTDVKNNPTFVKTDPSDPTQCDYVNPSYSIPGDWNNGALHQSTRNGKSCTEFIVGSGNGKFKESGTSNVNEALGAGDLVTLNGVPFGDLDTVYMGYNHGNNYIFFYIPNEMLNTTYNGGLATIEVKPGTRFADHYIAGFTLVYDPQSKMSYVVGAYNQSYTAATVTYGNDIERKIEDNGVSQFVRLTTYLNYNEQAVIDALGTKATYHRYFIKNLDTGVVTNQKSDNGIKYKTDRFIIDNVFTRGDKNNIGRYAVIIPSGTPLVNGSFKGYYKNSVIFYLTVGVNTFKTTSTLMGEREQYALTVKEFVTDYMHMSWGDASTNEGKCLGADGYYTLAKNYLLDLGNEFVTEFQTNSTFAAAKARYESWALLNGDATPYVKGSQYSANRTLVNNSNDNVIIVITSIAMLSLLGFYIYRKKRA